MTGSDCPLGAPVPGPSGSVPNLSPCHSLWHSSHPNVQSNTQPSPLVPPSTPTVTHISDTELEMMKALIECTELSNLHIRKLNILKQLRRDNSNVKDPISDDKEEDPVPVVSLYMRSNNNNPAPTLNTDLLSSNPNPSSASSLNNVPSISASPSATALGKWPAPPLSPLLPSSTSNIPPSDPTPIDYYSLPLIPPPAAASKNKLKLNVTTIPPSILQMAFNKMYIPLSMLTISALNCIRNNDNLKFKKVPFGNSAGKQSLNESQFPSKSSILLFFQAYRNWLSVIDIISNPQLALGKISISSFIPNS
ncbi:hypothetical protein K439DRAFT_1613244 [Ramaria rubella]|nr:hypothetical protein K439DRAFT_1613244 [Ramaria rubella]